MISYTNCNRCNYRLFVFYRNIIIILIYFLTYFLDVAREIKNEKAINVIRELMYYAYTCVDKLNVDAIVTKMKIIKNLLSIRTSSKQRPIRYMKKSRKSKKK